MGRLLILVQGQKWIHQKLNAAGYLAYNPWDTLLSVLVGGDLGPVFCAANKRLDAVQRAVQILAREYYFS